jgi:hypothetical protein
MTPETTRTCACGCGLPGLKTKKYVSDSHRKRAQRSGRAGEKDPALPVAAAVAPPAPNGNGTSGGRARLGLEQWLEAQPPELLPTVLTESARLLADQIDADPSQSAMWGRFVTLLVELVTPAVQERAFNDELRMIYEEMASIRVVEEWRHEQAQKALAAGKSPARWSALIPLGCAMGYHDWFQRGGPDSLKTCLDCRAHLGDDGTSVIWPDWLYHRQWDDEP